jgi:hypothetical protein
MIRTDQYTNPPPSQAFAASPPRLQPSRWVILHTRHTSAGQSLAGLPPGRAEGFRGIVSVGIVLAFSYGLQRNA